MSHFIDIGHQARADKSKPKQFAFYSQDLGKFESFNGRCLWGTIQDFEFDFIEELGNDYLLSGYLDLIPKRFSKYYKPFEGLADALHELYTGSISKDDVIIAQPLHGAHSTAPLVLGYLDDFEIETEIDEQNGGMTVTKIERKEANE
jgi:hypothetical protein